MLINGLLTVLIFSATFVLLKQSRLVQAAGSGNTSGFAWSENLGWISLNCDHTSLGLPLGDDTCADVSYGVLVEDAELSGFAWGEQTGWISLNCSNDASCGTVDYKVTNDNGVLSGYAWGENTGWIDFNPVGDEGVVVDAGTGIFSGYAWGENVGWISFGDGATYQVETTWRGILGQLDKPTNLRHTNNPESPSISITWAWDDGVNPGGTCYDIWLKDVAGGADYYYLDQSCSLTFTMNTDYLGNVLTANTAYSIKIEATHALYANSILTDPSSAYTSAASPANFQGAPTSETQINWTWQSGCAPSTCESGFYAQIKDSVPLIASGWQSAASWSSTGLVCGQNYTLQVKAKNADFDALAGPGDATTWVESDSVAIESLTAPLNAQLPEVDITATSMKLTWTDNSNEEGFIIERATGEDVPGSYSEIGRVGTNITFYTDNNPPLMQNTHYWYRVKAYSSVACDSGYAEADARTKGPKIAINPTTYPIGYFKDHYNFGVLEPDKTKSISMLICNLGETDLTVFSASIYPSNAFSSDAPGSFALGVDTVYHNCNNNLATQAKKEVVIKFTSPSSCNPVTSQADFILLNDDADKTVFLEGVCQESPVGKGEASENIIYDGRIMANPPPSFVEFLEKLQFSEKIKPR